EFETRIRQGAFSPKLLRPIHPIHADVADNVTYKLVGLVALIPAAIVLSVAFGATYQLTLGRALAFVPVILLAFVLRFAVEWTLSLAAFWTTRVGAINQAYNLAVIFLAGQMAPLSLFPAPVQTLASVLPYRWMVAFPVELILGKVDRSEIWLGLAMQVGWVAVSLIVLNVVWRFAARRYSAVGA
ncbi:MAG: ABC transporter permease, partial [Chloroflexota bacterium]